jgi:hypothetical protein
MTIGLGPQHHELVRQTIEAYMHQVMQDFDPMFWDDELEYLLCTWAERDHYYLTEASIHRVFEWCYGCQEQAQEEDRQWARQQQLAAQQVAAEQAAAQRAPADSAVIEPMSNITTVEREEAVNAPASSEQTEALDWNAPWTSDEPLPRPISGEDPLRQPFDPNAPWVSDEPLPEPISSENEGESQHPPDWQPPVRATAPEPPERNPASKGFRLALDWQSECARQRCQCRHGSSGRIVLSQCTACASCAGMACYGRSDRIGRRGRRHPAAFRGR